MRAEASFRNNHPGFRYGSAIAIPSGQPHSRLFFTFLPGCYAGEGGASFSSPHRLRLTTSGGTFS
ncbi:transcriptional regulator [Escherichia coli]|nr:transcriptional regulator [Escherichia coli]RRK40460.1 transcriptional regulator [Escherichia coli]